ncbi:hypothetical protein PT974_12067 [Cladobotryum mycophilum]|uniref:Uncharacterized protein n=1 Tax=Cladobotryum mycophilum TaxID=491253 RepID=A0ABR0S7Z8_9HYPO
MEIKQPMRLQHTLAQQGDLIRSLTCRRPTTAAVHVSDDP